MSLATVVCPSRFHRVPWVLLTLAALALAGFNVWIGCDPDDTENLETTRVLAAAHQFTQGLGSLYGPYSGTNPSVLIQAPLYYRLTGLAAWPLVASGMDPVWACFASGRLLSVLSFLGLLAVTFRLATHDGAPSRAGCWAALLVAASPIVGSFPVTMRPDMLGLLLQTAGLTLVLGVVPDRPRTRTTGRLILAFALFGLAFCTKQHFLVGPIVASGWLVSLWWRGELRRTPLLITLSITPLVILGVLAVEELLTGGAMSRSVFRLPGELQRVTAGSWSYVGVVAVETGKRGVGLLALAGAVAFAARGRLAFRALDRWLLLVIVLELALMIKLCLNSSGGWFNYALQALICASVLIGRGLATLSPERSAWRLAPVVLALVLVLATDVRLVAKGVALRRQSQDQLNDVLADPRVASLPASARYFPGTYQHYNRWAGHVELIHDEWLYRAFEAIDAAEPRERWLRDALTRGPVRLVITETSAETEAAPRVSGVAEPLTALGYESDGRVGRFDLWRRR